MLAVYRFGTFRDCQPFTGNVQFTGCVPFDVNFGRHSSFSVNVGVFMIYWDTPATIIYLEKYADV